MILTFLVRPGSVFLREFLHQIHAPPRPIPTAWSGPTWSTASMVGCRTCELVARRDSGGAPVWDQIFRTPSWDIVHAYGTSVEGWTVLVARRHITALAEMTDRRTLQLGPLVRSVSRAPQQTIGV